MSIYNKKNANKYKLNKTDEIDDDSENINLNSTNENDVNFETDNKIINV